jgi:hypothetical protein
MTDSNQLNQGDVVLSLGKGNLSNVIKLFTGGRHSHAALYNGQGITEATLPKAQKLERDMFEAKAEMMSALRHAQLVGAKKRSEIAAHADQYMGRPYNNGNLLITGALSTITAWIHGKNEWVAWNLKSTLGRAHSLLNVLAGLLRADSPEEGEAGAGVTCTELVVRSHLQAGLPIEVLLDPAGKIDFALLWQAIGEVRDRSGGSLTTSQSPLLDAAAESELRENLLWAEAMSGELERPVLDPTLQAPVAELQQLVLRVSPEWDAGGDSWYAGLVTPAQLSMSPSFKVLGRIQPGGWALGPDHELDELRKRRSSFPPG